jgi:hypothetical protein
VKPRSENEAESQYSSRERLKGYDSTLVLLNTLSYEEVYRRFEKDYKIKDSGKDECV